jgi:hypothetical protein
VTRLHLKNLGWLVQTEAAIGRAGRCDIIGVYAGRTYCIELKVSQPLGGIGQVLRYAWAFNAEPLSEYEQIIASGDDSLPWILRRREGVIRPSPYSVQAILLVPTDRQVLGLAEVCARTGVWLWDELTGTSAGCDCHLYSPKRCEQWVNGNPCRNLAAYIGHRRGYACQDCAEGDGWEPTSWRVDKPITIAS